MLRASTSNGSSISYDHRASPHPWLNYLSATRGIIRWAKRVATIAMGFKTHRYTKSLSLQVFRSDLPRVNGLSFLHSLSGLGYFCTTHSKLLSIDSVSAPVLSPLLVSFAIGPYMLLARIFSMRCPMIAHTATKKASPLQLQ